MQQPKSPTSGLQHVLVTTPFNFEKDCASDKFMELLKKTCEDVGASYVHVPWTEEHKQKPESTATPNKHFNSAGISLLTKSICDMHNKISSNSHRPRDSSCSSAPAHRASSDTFKLPTPKGVRPPGTQRGPASTSSGSSTSSTSSDSDVAPAKASSKTV